MQYTTSESFIVLLLVSSVLLLLLVTGIFLAIRYKKYHSSAYFLAGANQAFLHR